MAVPYFALLAILAQDPFERWLDAEAQKRFTERDREVAAITDAAGLRRREAYVRRVLPLRGIPNAGPLNAKITRRIERDGYTIENLSFESQPNFIVTANLYLPKIRAGRVPAILGVAGHSNNGKASATYQRAWIGFVRRGWAVLAYDPPGQGERVEYYDPELGRSKVGVGVPEHIMAGLPCFLTGRPLAHYFVQDGIRALDYLLTRPEIDPERIAVAGNSGGGTQAAYLAAVEPRLRAAVSSCYMTSWKHLWSGPGPQDAEQILPNFLGLALDFADFAYPFATRPFLITAAIRDYFPIDGARAAAGEMRRLSALLDHAPRAGFFEHDDTHGWSQPRRQAAVRWFSRWLEGRETDGIEAPSDAEEESILYATPEGRAGGTTVFELNRAYAGELRRSWTPPTRARLEALLNMPAPAPLATVLHPASDPARALIVVASPDSDSAEIRAFRESGHAVQVVVPRGAPKADRSGQSGYNYDYQLAARTWLLGLSIPAVQAADLLSVVRQRRDEGYRVWLYAKGPLGPAAVFAAALEPAIERVALENSIRSYRDIVDAKVHQRQSLAIVPGILAQFDLPELRQLSRARFQEISPWSPNGVPLAGTGILRRGEDWPLKRVLADWFN